MFRNWRDQFHKYNLKQKYCERPGREYLTKKNFSMRIGSHGIFPEILRAICPTFWNDFTAFMQRFKSRFLL